MGSLFLSLFLSASPGHVSTLRTEVVSTPDGPIAVTSKFSPQSKRANNWWDHRPAGHLFAKDEGNDGTLPLIDVRKGGL